jgi:hypothetical protein
LHSFLTNGTIALPSLDRILRPCLLKADIRAMRRQHVAARGPAVMHIGHGNDSALTSPHTVGVAALTFGRLLGCDIAVLTALRNRGQRQAGIDRERRTYRSSG